MRHVLLSILLLSAAAAVAACGGDKDHGHLEDDGLEHEGDDHAEHGEDDHDGHGHDDHDHGERVELGKVTVGAHSLRLAIFGEIEAGHEAILDIEVSGECAAVRAWIGIESGDGSLKARFEGDDGEYHGHLEAPAQLPAGSAIWVEIEDNDGTRHRRSFRIPREP